MRPVPGALHWCPRASTGGRIRSPPRPRRPGAWRRSRVRWRQDGPGAVALVTVGGEHLEAGGARSHPGDVDAARAVVVVDGDQSAIGQPHQARALRSEELRLARRLPVVVQHIEEACVPPVVHFRRSRRLTDEREMARIVPEARCGGLGVRADAPRPSAGGIREEHLVCGAPRDEREPAPVGGPGGRPSIPEEELPAGNS